MARVKVRVRVRVSVRTAVAACTIGARRPGCAVLSLLSEARRKSSGT